MTTVRFLFDGDCQAVFLQDGATEVAPAPTLLSVARDNNIPLLANCETGACGACLVEVKTHAGAGLPKSEAEVFFLRALGRLDQRSEAGVDARLACQYRLGEDEEIEVRFSTGIGCL